jgi:acyl-coenzyme A synthetase/AMP-(fatty) acid ligase
MSLIDRIRWQCRNNGPKPALSVPGATRDHVTYAHLQYHLDNACRKLENLGVDSGAVYGLFIREPLLNIVLMLALEELGAATVGMHAANAVDELPVAAVFTDWESLTCSRPIQRVHMNWLHGEGMYQPSRQRPRRSLDDVCRITLTSGSTGIPKGVAYTGRMLAERISRFSFALGGEFPWHIRTLSCMGLNSGWSYRLCVYLLSRGGMYCLSDLSLDRTIETISRYRIQNMVAPPGILAELCSSSQAQQKSFHPLELILATSSLLPRKLAERIQSNMCSRVINVYGSTEVGTVAAAPVEMLDLDNGDVGFVIPGVRVEIVDPVSGALARGGGGKVRIKSAANARGYFGRQGQEAGVFDDDSFYPGDLGYLSASGLLSIYGRDNNVVNIGGAKTTFELIEARLGAAPGVKEVGVALMPDAAGIKRPVAIIVPDAQWSEQQFWQHCRREVLREYWPSKLIMAQRIPRGAGGKIDRQALSSLA